MSAPVPGEPSEQAARALRDAGHGRRVYIAGPMTGLPEHNLPAFHEAAARLRAEGWTVISPAEMQTDEQMVEVARLGATYKFSPTYCACMRRDILVVLGCDAIYLLDGWERSSGARVEQAVAYAIGLEIRHAE